MTKADKPKSILLIGGPGTGKTHFGGQLLGRLREGRASLKLRSAVENVAPFEEALTCLGQGVTATHTPIDVYQESIFPIKTLSGDEIDLIWPDYGGEQITVNLIGQRRVSRDWRKRIAEGNAWMLFIRLDRTRDYDDILSRPVGDIVEARRNNAPENFIWSEQATLVELLQLLLYTKGIGTLKRVTLPALAIVLSCWDEMDATDKAILPADLLQRKMPLLSAFVNSTWDQKYADIYGLSSLGKSLKADTPDEDYMDQGPEKFGFVIMPDSSSLSDLTLPLARLTELFT